MNNAAYWAQRMKNMTDALEDKSYEYVKNLEEQFDRAISKVEKDIAYWYQRFADNNEIDLAEAKKLLTKGELKELKWSVEEYIKYGKENAINEQWMSELENASAKAHISRLDGLKLQLTQQAEKLSHLTEKATESAGKGIYEDCYYRTAFELQQQIGVGTVMGGIDERRIEKVLSRPWTTDNQTFRDRCWTNKTALVNSVNRELTQMIMRGEKPDRTINAIAKQFNVAKSKAGRLVMTESAFFAQQSQKDCFEELDVEKCKVVAALDKHTCPICGKLDGTIIKMSDYEVGSTAPPFHPWCRCTTAPYFEDMEGIGERYARDVETGESFTVPKDMTYEQWKKLQDEKHGAGTVDIERKKVYNEVADKKQFEAYKKRLGDEVPKTFKDFQSFKYTNTEAYKDLTEHYRYKGRVPEATKEDFETYKAIKQTGIYGSPRVPALKIDTAGYTLDEEHVKKRKHNVSIDEAKSYIENAYFSITRKYYDSDIIFTNYYSVNGAAYVDRSTKTIKTAFKQQEYDYKTRKAVEAYEKSKK